MELDRGTLAKIDRKLLAGLGQEESFRMVRVPVTAAMWSTWKRYCDAVGFSMGRAIMALIENELVSVFGESTGEVVPLLAGRAEEALTAREAQIASRERNLEATEDRLRVWAERLSHREGELRARERRTELVSQLASRPAATIPKVGRNDQCPCGSGAKYKRCHGG